MRALLVEHSRNNLRETARYFEAQFPKIVVLSARTIQDAQTTVTLANVENREIHVAVLHMETELDVSFADIIWSFFPDALVINFTAQRVEDVEERFSETKRQCFPGPVAMVSRRTGGGAPALWEVIRQYWETELLKRAQHALPFAQTWSHLAAGAFRRPMPGVSQVRCDTVGVNSLQREIADFWDCLSPEAKNKIRQLTSGGQQASDKDTRY